MLVIIWTGTCSPTVPARQGPTVPGPECDHEILHMSPEDVSDMEEPGQLPHHGHRRISSWDTLSLFMLKSSNSLKCPQENTPSVRHVSVVSKCVFEMINIIISALCCRKEFTQGEEHTNIS